MLSFAAVLNSHVRPSDEMSLLEVIHCAERGARLVGAVAVGAAAANDPPPGLAARLLDWLQRPQVGRWGQATRLALHSLRSRRGSAWHALAPWGELLRQASASEEPSIDHWLSDYATSLRHSGRSPPPTHAERLRRELAAQVTTLCDRLVALTPSTLGLVGEGHETALAMGDIAAPLAPFLELRDGALHVFDGASAAALRFFVLGPAAVRPSTGSEGRWVEDSGAWVTLGAAAQLDARKGSDPLLAFVSEAPTPTKKAPGARTAVAVDGVDALRVAEELAESWRSARQAVIVLPVDAAADPIERLDEVLGGGRQVSTLDALRGDKKRQAARSVLTTWLSSLPKFGSEEPPTPVVMPVAEDLTALLVGRLEQALGDAAVVVPVTTSLALEREWPPAAGLGRNVLRIGHRSVSPPAVAQRLRFEVPEIEAWVEAFDEVFGPDHLPQRLLLDALRGRRGLLDDPQDGLYDSWRVGDLRITPDGRLAPRHQGWLEFFAGFVDPTSDGTTAAHAAGRRIRARLAAEVPP